MLSRIKRLFGVPVVLIAIITLSASCKYKPLSEEEVSTLYAVAREDIADLSTENCYIQFYEYDSNTYIVFMDKKYQYTCGTGKYTVNTEEEAGKIAGEVHQKVQRCFESELFSEILADTSGLSEQSICITLSREGLDLFCEDINLDRGQISLEFEDDVFQYYDLWLYTYDAQEDHMGCTRRYKFGTGDAILKSGTEPLRYQYYTDAPSDTALPAAED